MINNIAYPVRRLTLIITRHNRVPRFTPRASLLTVRISLRPQITNRRIFRHRIRINGQATRGVRRRNPILTKAQVTRQPIRRHPRIILRLQNMNAFSTPIPKIIQTRNRFISSRPHINIRRLSHRRPSSTRFLHSPRHRHFDLNAQRAN